MNVLIKPKVVVGRVSDRLRLMFSNSAIVESLTTWLNFGNATNKKYIVLCSNALVYLYIITSRPCDVNRSLLGVVVSVNGTSNKHCAI